MRAEQPSLPNGPLVVRKGSCLNMGGRVICIVTTAGLEWLLEIRTRELRGKGVAYRAVELDGGDGQSHRSQRKRNE